MSNLSVGGDLAEWNLTGQIIDLAFKVGRHGLILEY